MLNRFLAAAAVAASTLVVGGAISAAPAGATSLTSKATVTAPCTGAVQTSTDKKCRWQWWHHRWCKFCWKHGHWEWQWCKSWSTDMTH